ncbi:hypothetical protein D3C80_1566460 [compost metagenome]
MPWREPPLTKLTSKRVGSPCPGPTSRRLVLLPTTSGWPEPTNRLSELSSCATTVTPTKVDSWRIASSRASSRSLGC